MTPVADIQALLERFSAAWQASDFEALEGILHSDVVFVSPDLARQARGRDACLETYRQFLGAAKIVAYREPETSVDVFGTTAVATVRWEMTWEMSGKEESDRGHDVLVLVSDGTRWEIVWRTQVPASK